MKSRRLHLAIRSPHSWNNPHEFLYRLLPHAWAPLKKNEKRISIILRLPDDIFDYKSIIIDVTRENVS